MPRRATGVAAAVLVVLAAPLATGCRADGGAGAAGDGDDAGSADRARSRAAVQDAARSLLSGAETALPARAANRVAGWEGCASAFPEGWATVRWSVEARLDLTAEARARPPYLAPLRPVLADAGFGPVTRAPGHPPRTTLGAERDGVEATLTHTGAGRFVLVAVRGGCVEAGEEHDGVR